MTNPNAGAETFGPFIVHREPVSVEEWLDATEEQITAEANHIAEAEALATEAAQRDADVLAAWCLTGTGHSWELQTSDAGSWVECSVCSEAVAR
jgi:hypothetical protein